MSITAFKREVWDAALVQNFHDNAVVVPTLNNSYEGEVAHGSVVHLTNVTTPTISAYTGNVTYDDLTDANIDISIDQARQFAFKVKDVDKAQAAGSLDPVTADASLAMSEDADAIALTKMIAGGQSLGTTALTDFASAYAVFTNARTKLRKAKLPNASRYALVTPEFSALLLGPDSNLVKVNEYGTDGPIMNGEIGRLLGFTVLESAVLNAAANTASGVFYYGPMVGFANQISEVEALRLQDDFADGIRGLHTFGASVVKPAAVQSYIVPAS